MNNDMNFNNQYNNPQYQNVNNMNANMNNNQPNYSNYQGYNNQNLQQPSTKKKNNILKIILIILGIIVGIFIISKIFGGSSSSGGSVGTGKDVTVKNKIYNMIISASDVQKGVVYNNSGDVSSNNLNGTYTKIKITIKNNNSKEASINPYLVSISLMDSSKNKIASCSYGLKLNDKNIVNEKLQDTIPANSTASGYIYCKTDSTLGTILYIKVPSNVTTSDNNNYDIDYEEYYLSLN